MKRLLFLLMFLAVSMFTLSQTASAQTNIFNQPKNPQSVCKRTTAANTTICTVDGSKDPISGSDGILIKATRLIALVGGTVAVIIILISSFIMVSSGSEAPKIKGARKAIIGSIIGLVIILSTQTIVIFVVSKIL